MTALQHLPPRQRAALILCEVLRWQAAETAELLDTSVAAVNSALQRARATLADAARGRDRPDEPAPRTRTELLAQYVDAFERYDMTALVRLLHEDAVQSMPPYAMWLRGAEDIGAWMIGPGAECEGSRLLPVAANGSAGVRPVPGGPGRRARAVGASGLEITGGRITGMNVFLDTGRPVPRLRPARAPAARVTSAVERSARRLAGQDDRGERSAIP